MGLDMYFYAVKIKSKMECHWDENAKPVNYPKGLKAFEDDITQTYFKCIDVKTSYLIGYFRKFNALHSYIVEKFANGTDDCNPVYLAKDDILQILSDLNWAKKGKTSKLPTKTGFFFGSTEYDVDEAINLFEKILHNIDFKKYYIEYHASW